MKQTTTIQVRSARELDASTQKSIIKFATKKLNSDVSLDLIIDKNLLAGFKFNLKGIEYDYSIAGSLEQLAGQL